MTELNQKIRTALNESRILILGTQILLGFQYRAFFERSFESMTSTARHLQVTGLVLLVIAIGLLIWPGSYHRIVQQGEDSVAVHEFTTAVMDITLLPVMLVIGIDIYLVTSRVWGSVNGAVAGAGLAAFAFVFWYGIGFLSRWQRWDSEISVERRGNKDDEMEKTPITDKVDHVLTETRVVLPGAQVLLGFQFATMLMETFATLPSVSRYVHSLSLVCIAISVILLMTPAAYHRIVERGGVTNHFHSVASALLLAAMVFLPLGLCGELYVVLRRVTTRESVAVGSALVALGFFYSLWFGFTVYRRKHPKTN
jgi:hypothetical protein